MWPSENTITVFEHEMIRHDKGEKRISKDQLNELLKYHDQNPGFFSPVYNGVKFNENVGVIQVGKTFIEVLPKADKNPPDKEEEGKWRKILIGILRAVGSFDVNATSEGDLKIKPNHILDLYIKIFLEEVEMLLHRGLIKRYRKIEENIYTLKGSLHFQKNINKNIVHQERFFVRHSSYELNHVFHCILYKTIQLISVINKNPSLQSRISLILLYFPEMPFLGITEATFNSLVFHRKTMIYKKSINIAKMLLLNYHPDICKGNNNVLALMFNMNKLWELFVYRSLKKFADSELDLKAQHSTYFWQSSSGNRVKLQPDILIKSGNKKFVVDTKWKNIENGVPSVEDLRQMYAYNEFFDADKSALFYPSKNSSTSTGNFYATRRNPNSITQCSIILSTVPRKIGAHNYLHNWQRDIYETIKNWMVAGE